MDLQKNCKYNSLGKIGAWEKHFKALRRFGIHVKRLMIDNLLLERQNEILKNEIVELREVVKFHYEQSLWAHKRMVWFTTEFPERHEHTYPDKNVVLNPLDIVFHVSIKN